MPECAKAEIPRSARGRAAVAPQCFSIGTAVEMRSARQGLCAALELGGQGRNGPAEPGGVHSFVCCLGPCTAVMGT